MKEFNKDHIVELRDLIKYDNAVLFLGQDYQIAFGSNNFFLNNINSHICNNKASQLTYPSLWSLMSDCSKANKKEGGHAVIDENQRNQLQEIGACVPQNKKLVDVLNIGWASVVTSAIDPGIVNAEGFNCNPIYNVNTKPAGIANKRKLHVTYMFGCVTEKNSYPVSYKIRGNARSDAEKMYSRVLQEAIMYSGALVIDGWNPEYDWASIDILLGNGHIDADMAYPKIYIFNCTSAVKNKIYETECTEELAESDKLIVSDKSLYECLEDYIIEINEERRAEKEALESSEVISFRKGKKNIEIYIPTEQLRELNPEQIHLLTPRDRMPVSYDQEGIRNLTIKFLSNPSSEFPYWQGYLQNCCFDRDVYRNQNKTGLYDRAESILKAPNLHKVANTIILHGQSNSGKTVLLGKLAMELSERYPVLYIKGEIETEDPDICKQRYQSIVNFINTYLTRNNKLEEKVRAVVIWDNNVFVDKVHNYNELADELSESNTLVIGSAYEIRNTSEGDRKPKKDIEYIYIEPTLNPETEYKNLEKMLSQNLGSVFLDALSQVKQASLKNKKNCDLIHDTNRILFLLRNIFRISGDDTIKVIEEAINRTNQESSGVEDLMHDRFVQAINKATRTYNTDLNGLAEILAECTEDNQKGEDWYHQLEICAPTLNDILAMAGQFGIRLPSNLVKKVICDVDICPDIKYYMDAVDEILAFDTMLEFPFPVDDVGHTMLGYRSPYEAEIYLNNHYTRRGNIDITIQYDNEGNEFLEDREIYLLEKIIEYSNLEDYSSYNWHTVTTVRELLDQFGTNSRKGEAYARQYEYKYDELATFILQHGGSENPEMALSAAFLKREQIRSSMLNNIQNNYNITDVQRKILDDAADGLEHAIEIEERDNNAETQRMMRIYVEWCTNRNYTLDRENPSPKDIEIFRQIHTRFAKALTIYMKQNVHRMKPMNMMDVYLNGFSYYTMAMERIYHIDSAPELVAPVKMNEYSNEISYAMNTVLGKLLDFDDIVDSRVNLNNNILNVYKLANRSTKSLEVRAKAHGSAAYILLNARNMWIQNSVSFNKLGIHELKDIDTYLTSDYAERPGMLSDNVIRTAKDVYEYLIQPSNISVLMSKRKVGEKEIAGLEMLIRSAWIAKTGNMPFTLNQFPQLSIEDWSELHKYCRNYVESGNERAKYAFAYYLEGIYYWSFTSDSWNYSTGTTPSKERFDYCLHNCVRPRGVYSSDSFIYLCEPGTGKPIKLNARIKRQSVNRSVADITSATDKEMTKKLPYLNNKQKIYCSQSLHRQGQKNSIESRRITIRFNLQGALAGPENPETEVTNFV